MYKQTKHGELCHLTIKKTLAYDWQSSYYIMHSDGNEKAVSTGSYEEITIVNASLVITYLDWICHIISDSWRLAIAKFQQWYHKYTKDIVTRLRDTIRKWLLCLIVFLKGFT